MSQTPRPIFTKSRTTKRPRSSGGGGGGSGRGGYKNIPSQTPGRFHGAFTGGYSAGHYNTVGTEDGWRPTADDDDIEDDNEAGGGLFAAVAGPAASSMSTSSTADKTKKRPRVWQKSRSAADYMDDRDYDEWAGPTGVSAEYAPTDSAAAGAATTAKKSAIEKDAASAVGGGGLGLVPSELLEPVTGPADAIGRKLLRKLGWRGGDGDTSSAYVPTHDDDENKETKNDNSHETLLSKKRLKKIQLSERGHSLPSPKIDTYGLGYDPYKNAPEFAAHKKMRRQRAEERARAAGGGYGRYHAADLLDDDDEDGEATRVDDHKGPADDSKGDKMSSVLAYETAEDFVGKTGVGGFALHDDEDDVYDNIAADGISNEVGSRQTLVGIGGEVYHTELIDHGESDVEDANGAGSRGGANGGMGAFEGALSAWASKDVSSEGGDLRRVGDSVVPPAKAVTSDGRSPLDGFVLGGSGGETDVTNKRWPGPDLPPNYDPVKHVFREEDLPERVAEKSRNARSEAEASRKAKAGVAASVEAKPYVKAMRDTDKPMAGTVFAGLAAAMKDRFTSGAGKTDSEEDQVQVGLHVTPANGVAQSEPSEDIARKELAGKEKKEITVKCSVMLWNPEPLLCKRLGVRPPRRAGASTPSQSQQQSSEQSYFQKEILGAVSSSQAPAPAANGKEHAAARDATTDADPNDAPIRPPQPGVDIGDTRPPMDLFKSIFGADSSDDSDETSSSEGEDVETVLIETDEKKKNAEVKQQQIREDKMSEPLNIEQVDTSAATMERQNEATSIHHQQRRRSDSPGGSSSASSSYERRRRKKKKKRRKDYSTRSDDSRKRSKDSRRKKKRKRSRSRSRSRERREDSGARDERKKKAKKSSKSRSG